MSIQPLLYIIIGLVLALSLFSIGIMVYDVVRAIAESKSDKRGSDK